MPDQKHIPAAAPVKKAVTVTPQLAAVAGLAALAVAMGIGRFAFTPILPMMLQDAGLSIRAGGLLASANYVGYLIGALSAIALRVRPEVAIRAGLAAVGVTTLAMAMALPFAAWMALRLLAGVASAWILISISAWAMETLSRLQRPQLGSMVFSGVGTGIAAAGVLCVVMTAAGAHSSHAWSALGVLSLAATLILWQVFRPAALQAPGSAPAAPPAPYRWNRDALRLVACYGLYGFGYIIPATFLPVMAKNALDGSSLFGWSWPVFGAAAALSTPAVATLVRRIGNRRVWIVSHLVMAAGILMPLVLQGLPGILIAALCVGGTFMVVTLVAVQEARRIAGQHATVLIAAMTSAFAAGQIAGPLTVSAGLGSAGFTGPLVAAAALLLTGALLLWPDSAVPKPQPPFQGTSP